MGAVGDQLVDTLDQYIPHLKYALEGLSEKDRYYYQGTNNPIAYSAWHSIRGLDEAIIQRLMGEVPVWEAKGHREKLGPMEQSRFTSHDDVLNVKVEPWEDFLAYTDDVLATLHNYLKNATDEDLNVIVKDGRIDSAHPVADYSRARVIRGRVTHVTMHLGEIYAIRGALGMKGSPI